MAAHYEEGLYKARIINQTLAEGEAKPGGKDTAPSVQLTVLPIGFFDSQNEFHEQEFGHDRTIYLYLTEETVGRDPNKPGWVLDTLRYLGFNGSSFGQLDLNAPNAISFIDLEVDVLCRHEEYKGKVREKWSIFRPKEKKENVPASSKVVRNLDARFGKLLKLGTTTPSVPLPAPNGVPMPPPVAPPAPLPNGKKTPAAKKNPLPQAIADVKQSDNEAEAFSAGPGDADIPF